jgi:hypothetical protein
MGNREQVGFANSNQHSQMVLSAATALGTTDTSVINWPQIAVDGVVTNTGDAFTATTTAANGTQITLDLPGYYRIDLYIALAGAGVLQGGISRAGTVAPFVTPPIDFSVATAGFLAVGGEGTLATTRALIAIGAFVNNDRADINGTLNLIRLCATVGVTLDADNTRCRIQYLGRNGQY